jgi:magnesium transporter
MKHSRKFKKIDLHKLVPKTVHQGTVHGKIEYIGKPREGTVAIDLLEYDELNVRETAITSIENLKEHLNNPMMKWIRVTGVHEAQVLGRIGELFNINAIDIEDIANTTQRPRIEERDLYIFLEFNLLQIDPETHDVINEQVAIIQGKNYVITFHETHPKVFESLHNRILTSKGSLRKLNSDYLIFAITDIIIDQYFLLLEDIGETVEDVEEQLVPTPDQSSQEAIYRLKRRLIYVKKTIWPTREVLSSLQRSDHVLINEATKIYFRNVYDHTVQVIETLESLRDITAGMMDLYLSSVSNRMNEIMKVLTVFSAIFIPLTFLAGVYGMNFRKKFPELDWEYGYFIFWIICIIAAVIMLFYFRRKKWL